MDHIDVTDTAFFDSWKRNYKDPFGAVQVGQTVRFHFSSSAETTQLVSLVIHKDFGKYMEIPMVSSDDPGLYVVDFSPLDGSGLYFYHFRILSKQNGKEDIRFYGNNQNETGGQGSLIDQQVDVRNYQLTVFETEEKFPKWYTEGVAYHIFVDRFFNGQTDGKVLHPKKNSFLYSTPEDTPMYIRNKKGDIERWEFFGGNLKGIIIKLDQLHQMGITILFLSPIFQARSNHKYDTADYFSIDEMFGDLEDFKELIGEAKKRGMRIILDGVFNHTGADSRYFNRFGTYGEEGAYQLENSVYANWYTFQSFPDEYEAWWGIQDLPRLNTEHPEVRAFLYEGENSVVRYWAKQGIGGFRIDVADELSDEVLAGIRQALEESSVEPTILIGEVWEDATAKLAYGKRRHYLEGGMLQSVMNYPFRTLILDMLKGNKSAREGVMSFLHLKENYPHKVFIHLFNNVGTHDTARLATELNQDTQKIQLAFVMLMTLPGIPCIYYGDEKGVEGRKDPDNRRIYPWGTVQHEWIETIEGLSTCRQQSSALIEGDFHPFYCAGVFGYIRVHEEDWAVVLINIDAESKLVHMEDVMSKTDFPVRTFLKERGLSELKLAPYGYILKTAKKESVLP